MTTDDDGSGKTVAWHGGSAPGAAQTFGHFLSFTLHDIPQRIPFEGFGVTVGRTAPAEIVIPMPEVSRQHCRIDIMGEYAFLSDLGSTNGTLVDGVRLQQPTRILSGTQFTLGSFPVRYERRDLREVAQELEHTADLQRAEDYVRAILPQPLTTGPVQVEWCFIPSAKLGGDAFGYEFLTDELFTGFLLDVSGHGLGSAMHAATVANALRRHTLPGVDFEDPAQVAAGLNEVFPMEEHNGLMFSIWCFTYHVPTRELRFCAAGHHPSLLITPGAPEPAPLWQRSPVIGMLPFGKWATGTAEIPSGARLFVFSDGAFEIVDKEGRQWTMEDLRQIMQQPAIEGVTEPYRLYQAVQAAARPGPLDDDFSVMQITFV